MIVLEVIAWTALVGGMAVIVWVAVEAWRRR